MRARLLLHVASLIACGALAAPADAQGPPVIRNPGVLQPRAPAARLSTMLSLAPKAAPVAEQRDVIYDLTIKYTPSTIWNPTENRPDNVRLRSYVGAGVDPTAPFVGPQIEVYPGQTVRMTLHNELPDDPNCSVRGGSTNVPHCFNGTNLHTHGLWVNPNGNGDNVLVSINPGVTFQYEYNLPPDHPAGTFWYHSHRHGSTALQVSSGMAGALIVRGTRPPTPDGNGDLDTLLKPIGTQPFTERVMVFQQIQYACRDSTTHQIEYNKDKDGNNTTYKCDANETAGVEDYDQFGPGTWPASGRFTSINGAVLGTLPGAQAGKVERWRMIHGGVRDSIALQFRKRADQAPEPVGLRAAAAQAYVDTNCTGAPLTYHLVAADGLTMAAATPAQVAVFQPGYRWDALVVFPEKGDYCILDSQTGGTINQNFQPTQLLGTVHVDGTPAVTDVKESPSDFLKTQLLAAATANMPKDVLAKVSADIKDGLKLTSFVPHPDVNDGEVTGTQTLTFNIDTTQFNEVFFEVNGQPYDGNRIDRTLMLGGVDEWTLKSDFVSHPFHIHVNPFQIVKIIAPDGKTDVSAPGAVDNFQKDDKGNPIIDPQYPGLKGVWKDTLLVKNFGFDPSTQYTIVVRTRYQRYIGDFVLHCHILDHEDQGMMQNVRIAVPDGKGSVASSHH
jgi:FtsP/CotA-like multicopper oxidase with cupredoxin domain